MYNIYLLEDPKQMVQSWDANGNPVLTPYDTLAQQFETETEAVAVYTDILIPSGDQFWGARPVRRRPK